MKGIDSIEKNKGKESSEYLRAMYLLSTVYKSK